MGKFRLKKNRTEKLIQNFILPESSATLTERKILNNIWNGKFSGDR